MKRLFCFKTSEGETLFATDPKAASAYFRHKSRDFRAVYDGVQVVKEKNLVHVARGVYRFEKQEKTKGVKDA